MIDTTPAKLWASGRSDSVKLLPGGCNESSGVGFLLPHIWIYHIQVFRCISAFRNCSDLTTVHPLKWSLTKTMQQTGPTQSPWEGLSTDSGTASWVQVPVQPFAECVSLGQAPRPWCLDSSWNGSDDSTCLEGCGDWINTDV